MAHGFSHARLPKGHIYFAFAPKTHRRSFKDTVQAGLIKAFRALREGQLNLPPWPQFLLPMNLHIMVVETCWAANGLYRVLWEASAIGPCLPEELRWLRTSFQLPILQPVARLWEDTNGADGEVSREEAERIHDEEIRRAGIPLSSTTARCMFYATEGKRGKWCRFGATPLWDNCLRVVDGKVSRSELMGWIGRLIESGHKSQKAGQVAYRAVAGIVTEQKVELEALEYGQ